MVSEPQVQVTFVQGSESTVKKFFELAQWLGVSQKFLDASVLNLQKEILMAPMVYGPYPGRRLKE